MRGQNTLVFLVQDTGGLEALSQSTTKWYSEEQERLVDELEQQD
jgi:hypothetical protein